ncbi:hypothetical protein OROHE_002937 [Orobanche hederae]
MTIDKCSWRRQLRVVDSFLGSGSVVESLSVWLCCSVGRSPYGTRILPTWFAYVTQSCERETNTPSSVHAFSQKI